MNERAMDRRGNVDKRDETRIKCELVVSRLRLRLRGNVDISRTFPRDGRVVTMARLERVDHSCSFSQADESQLAGYQPSCRSKSSTTWKGERRRRGQYR